MPDQGINRNRTQGTNAAARWLRRKNIVKRVRIVLQIALLALLVFLLVTNVFFPQHYQEERPEASVSASSTLAGSTNAAAIGETGERDTGFIAISYCGVTTMEGLDTNIVSKRDYEEQLAALYASGYRTITQQDILNYYEAGTPLPEKSLFLILEDGILNSSTLAQPALERYNYKATFCTFAQYLNDRYSKFATAADIRRLMDSSYWELGSNGYRLSYINVFDRYGNYFGHLNTNEFVLINQYLRRDYNHYLMDFLRDADRMRQETEQEMQQRIDWDYAQMESEYTSRVGFMPKTYILMHSNTGAFGNDALVSDENAQQMMQAFSMNFNRQGSCLNTRASSIYDLTRLQSQPYFSTNHLLMRIKDDTGDDVVFAVGDEKEAERWYLDKGAAEFKTNQIILTSEPFDEGRMTLKSDLVADVEVSATLTGNAMGKQSICLRADRDLTGGVQVALEDNILIIRDLSNSAAELLRLDLFEFDGGATKSKQEDEYEGLEALYETIIRYDEDPERIAQAKRDLEELHTKRPRTLAEGGTPYVPVQDISRRDSRNLRIRVVGKRISVWLDGRIVAENLPLISNRRGNVVLTSGVWMADDVYSQSNIADDVYDARFVDLVVRDANDGGSVLYSYQLSPVRRVLRSLNSGWQKVVSFFLNVI